MTSTILFDPLLPWPVIAACLAVATFATGLAVLRGLSGWALRGLAATIILIALAGPVWQQEDRETLNDIAIMVVDRSASQMLGDRNDATEAAAVALAARIQSLPDTELRRIDLSDGPNDTGTLAMTALTDALAEEPLGRISGLFLISDGRAHDIDTAPNLPAPLHLLLTGHPEDWDRRLIVENAPAYAILGEEFTLTLKIEDQGAVPAGLTHSPLEISLDGDTPMVFQIPVGKTVELPITLPHGGRKRASIHRAAG